jgi:hypothetical protein
MSFSPVAPGLQNSLKTAASNSGLGVGGGGGGGGFSVTDILSAAAAHHQLGDDTLKKTSLDATIPPLFPGAGSAAGGYYNPHHPHHHHQTSQTPAVAVSTPSSMSSMAAAAAAQNAYNYQLAAAGQLAQNYSAASSFGSQYCQGTAADFSGYGDPMQGIRSSAAAAAASASSWYGNAAAADPRIASEYTFPRKLMFFVP